MAVLLLMTRGALLLAAAFAVAFVVRRRRAAVRADLWRATFVALAALPLIGLLAPSVEWVPAPWAPVVVAETPVVSEAAVPSSVPNPGFESMGVEPSVAVVSPAAAAAPAPAPLRIAKPLGHWPPLRLLGGLWALVALGLALRMVLSLRRAALIARSARPVDLESTPTGVRTCASDQTLTPFVLDLRPFAAPTVVLPAILATDAEGLRAALAHEMAHVERRDGAFLILGALVSAFLWPTVLAGLALRRLRAEIELAADDAALRAGVRPSEYAAQLMAIGQTMSAVPAMAAPPLARRVTGALAEGVDRRPSGGVARAAALALALGSAAMVGSSSWAARVEGAVEEAVQEAVKETVARQAPANLSAGVKALLAMQDPDTGAWRGDVGYKLNKRWRVTAPDAPHVGVTGLAVEALVKAGMCPSDEGPGLALSRGAAFLVASQDRAGYFSAHGTRMRDHAHALRGLAELLTVSGSDALVDPVTRGFTFSLNARSSVSGGWRFTPFSKDADIIETAHQIEACRGAFHALGAPKALDELFCMVEDQIADFAHLLRNDELDGRIVPGITKPEGYRLKRTARSRTSLNTNLAGLVVHMNIEREAEQDGTVPLLDVIREDHGVLVGRDLSHFLRWDAELLGHRAIERGEPIASGPSLDELPVKPGTLPPNDVLVRAATTSMWRAFTKEWREVSNVRLSALAAPDGQWPNSVGVGDAYSTAVGCLIEAGR